MKPCLLKKNLLFSLLLILFLIGAYANAQTINWVQATSSALWSARVTTTVVFQNKIWIVGGQDSNGNLLNDVWSSSDGVNWTEVTASAPWAPRADHTVIVFNNKMWLMGGSLVANSPDWTGKANDIWSSSDGINWTQVTSAASWPKRYKHTSVVFDNKIWVIGGGSDGGGWLNDVWYSSDGTNWTQATSSAQWSPRYCHSSTVYNGAMWVLGGNSSSGNLNDVWYSTDGITWTLATANAAWSARSFQTTVVFNNGIWLFGGLANGTPQNDVWFSQDGINWTQVNSSTICPARYGHNSATFNNKIWVLGGHDGSWLNDVWYSSPSNLSVLPASFNFGSVSVGNSSNPQTFTILNTGDTDLTIGTIILQGANASEFQITNDASSGRTILPGSGSTFQAFFSPTSAGSKTASVSIPSSDPMAPTLSIPLSGKGISGTILRIAIEIPAGLFHVNDTIVLTTNVTGASDNPSYSWYLDGNKIENETSETLTLQFQKAGTYKIEVQVIDSSGQTAGDCKYLTIDNIPQPNEPVLIPAIAPSNGTFLDRLNDVSFAFDTTRINAGIIIITHGWTGTAYQDSDPYSWLRVMAWAADNRLKRENMLDPSITVPNICRYDWSENADVSLLRITQNGLAQGRILAKWIQEEVRLGHINPNAPIHIIGHSAGGYVAVGCVEALHSILPDLNIQNVRITLLDTPLENIEVPLVTVLGVPIISASFAGALANPSIIAHLTNKGTIDAYRSKYMWLLDGLHPPSWYGKFSAQHRYCWDISSIVANPPYNLISPHSAAHDWYTGTIMSDTNADPNNSSWHSGFYYSPWLNHSFPSDEGAMSLMGLCRTEGIAASSTRSPARSSTSALINGFEFFGDVSETDNVYTIKEGVQSNGGIFKILSFPQNTENLTFRYIFTTSGDGDFLSVHLKDDTGTDTLLYVGPDLGENYLDGVISGSELAGKTGQLIFKLNSRGEQNAVLSLDSIQIQISNIPPNNPQNFSPDDGAINLSLTPTLQASPFSDSNTEDTHKASQWQIRTATGTYDNPIWDSGIDTTNKTTITVPSGKLDYLTTYFWHVRYQDNNDAWSDWSKETSFTTESEPSGSEGGGGGCFIATAAFGSPLAKQIEILREFRDKYLLTNYLGKKFVNWYYKNSPEVAKFISMHLWAKFLTKIILYPVIAFAYLIVKGLLAPVILLLSSIYLLRIKTAKF